MKEAENEIIMDIQENKKNKDDEFVHYQKINFFGEDGVGKSSFISYMENYNITDYIIDNQNTESNASFNINSSLVEEHIKRITIEINEDRNLYFQIYETSLNKYENIKNYLDILLIQTECIIIMWDISSPETFDNIPNFVTAIESGIKGYKYPDVPIFIIQNKMDLISDDIDKNIIDQKINTFKTEHPKVVYEEMSLIGKEQFYDFMLKIYRGMEILEKANNDKNNGETLDIEHVKYIYPLKDSNVIKREDVLGEANCLLLGNSTVGKTSFINCLFEKDINNTISTAGIDKTNIVSEVNNEKILIRLIDTAGQDHFSVSVPKNNYRNAVCILLFYDVKNQTSFDNIKNWIQSIIDVKGNNNKNYGLFLIGNKIDCNEKREIEKKTAQNLAEEFKIKYFECSCLNKINVYEILNEIILVSYISIFKKENKDRNTITLNKTKLRKNRNRCCNH